MVFGFGLNTGFWTCGSTGRGSGGSGLGLGPSRNGDRLGGGIELKIAADELVIGPLVLEKNNFAEGLAADLKTNVFPVTAPPRYTCPLP